MTAIAPAGGWTRFSLSQIIIGAKFAILVPLVLLGRITGDVGRRLGPLRNLVMRIVSADVAAVPRARADNIIRAASNCPSFLAYLWADLRDGGVRGLDKVTVPVQFVFCAEDWLMPQPRYSRMFTDALPQASVTTLAGVGHVPALETPELVAEMIRAHIEAIPNSESA